MNLFKKTAIAAALSSFALAASAMSPIQDADLSQVSGQDGVSIAANLNVNIGSFTYTNTAANGGSVSFNDIGITGLIAATLDVVNGATFGGAMTALGATPGANFGQFYAGGDVVQIAVPDASVVTAPGKLVSISVASIKMGGSSASFGSMAMSGINLGGTTAFIWAH